MKTSKELKRARAFLVRRAQDSDDVYVLEALKEAHDTVVHYTHDLRNDEYDATLAEKWALRDRFRAALIRDLKKRLSRIRRAAKQGDVSELVRALFAIQCRHKIALEEVGSSADEINKLLRTGYLSRAQRSLATLRKTVASGKANYNNKGPLEDVPKYLSAARANVDGPLLGEYQVLARDLYALLARVDLRQIPKIRQGDELLRAIDRLKRNAKRGALTLSELGTSEEDLYARARAMVLKEAREHAEDYRVTKQGAQRIRQYLNEGFPPAELGVNPEIIAEEAVIERTREEIELIRRTLEGVRRHGGSAKWVAERIPTRGMTPEDFGTSEVELRELEHAYQVRQAMRALREMRQEPGAVANEERGFALRKCMRDHGVTFMDLETTEQELDLLCGKLD